MLILPELNALFSVSPRRPNPDRPRHDACISLFVTIFLLFISPIPPLANAAGNAAARHRIRHTRQGSSRDSHSDSRHKGQSWSLHCPHVTDSNNDQVRIDVVWTRDDAIWLKIEDGEKRIYNQLTSFHRRKIAGKTVLRVILNEGRYFFDYDELTGDFTMEIRPVVVEQDVGVWQCHVTVHNRHGVTHSMTSRSRVKQKPHDNDGNSSSERTTMPSGTRGELLPRPAAFSKTTLIERQPDRATSSFSRPDQGTIEINRDHVVRHKTIVFDRPLPMSASGISPHRTPHHFQSDSDFTTHTAIDTRMPRMRHKNGAASSSHSIARRTNVELAFAIVIGVVLINSVRLR